MNTRDKIDINLWQGQEPERGFNPEPVGKDIDVLVLCYQQHQEPWSRFAGRPGLTVIESPMDDDGETLSTKDLITAMATAELVTEHLSRGDRVLITCHMGLNRSGLVTALVLHNLYDWTGKACVRHVRLRRPGALFNLGFASYLETLP